MGSLVSYSIANVVRRNGKAKPNKMEVAPTIICLAVALDMVELKFMLPWTLSLFEVLEC